MKGALEHALAKSSGGDRGKKTENIEAHPVLRANTSRGARPGGRIFSFGEIVPGDRCSAAPTKGFTTERTGVTEDEAIEKRP